MARDILTTVRGLLAKANDKASTPAESEAFYAKAQELMTKFQIDAETAIADGTAVREDIVRVQVFGRANKGERMIKAKRELWYGLARANSCTALQYGHNGRDSMDIFGHASDVEMIQALYASMVTQMNTDLARAQNVREVVGASGVVSYAHGWVRRVVRRLELVKAARVVADTVDDAPSTALVLVDREKTVDTFMREDIGAGKIRTLRPTSSVRDGGAYGAGDRDGRNADLGGTRLGGRGALDK